MFLKVDELTKKFDKHTVLDRLSFTVEQGELLCVLGPSGCGKSTLLRCLNGFEALDHGQIFLEERDITEELPEERNVTTVFQNYSLFPHMDVLHNVMYGLKFQKVAKKEAAKRSEEMLELLQLKGYGAKRIMELSGGEQQRVALGRSLIVNPKLLLLDEPLSNLDEKLRVTLREELRTILKKLDMTGIFVTHDQKEAFAIGDKILLLNQGKIQQFSDGISLYEHPQNQFVLDFIGEKNQLSPAEYVRPERVILEKDAQGDGKVEKVVFQGETWEYYIRTKDYYWRALALNRSREAGYQVGDRVKLTVQMQELISSKEEK
ncbi:ABC transporter ATP-binding protein [Enterococcus hirae]|nr:ABC transporter ATP-binding protein [Enterococcus hirae]